MANGLPMPNGMPVGGPPMGGPMPGAMPGGGPQDEVGQLLALREQIDQRLSELMGPPQPEPTMAMTAGPPTELPESARMPGGMPPGLLAGAGPY